ncbi:hypothetical protein M0R45_009477 [Rubus argutus]|uniref:Secreted protein n=1 Tax=Rubus argutus TaxID=59490 RepID=A0AAW1Y677_RUBAR
MQLTLAVAALIWVDAGLEAQAGNNDVVGETRQERNDSARACDVGVGIEGSAAWEEDEASPFTVHYANTTSSDAHHHTSFPVAATTYPPASWTVASPASTVFFLSGSFTHFSLAGASPRSPPFSPLHLLQASEQLF